MSDALIDGLSQVIFSLKPTQRRQLLNRLVDSHVLSEDEEDALLVELRKDEAPIPYKKIRRDLKKKGRLK